MLLLVRSRGQLLATTTALQCCYHRSSSSSSSSHRASPSAQARDFLFGYNVVLPALRAGRRDIHRVYLQESLRFRDTRQERKVRAKPGNRSLGLVLDEVKSLGVAVEYVPRSTLDKMSLKRPHNGVVVEASQLDVDTIGWLTSPSKQSAGGGGGYHAMTDPKTGVPFDARQDGPPLWLLLDALSDPQNVGAVLRSAYYFGVDGVALTAKGSSQLTNTVSKASAGALEVMDVFYARRALSFIQTSKRNGWRIVGAGKPPPGVSQTSNVDDTRRPTILIMGNEHSGVRSSLHPLVDKWMWIPSRISSTTPPGDNNRTAEKDNEQDEEEEEEEEECVDSLNVSVATGILLHQLTVQV